MSLRNEALYGLAACLLFASRAQAVDLSGAWANNLDVCSKIFVKKDNRISLTENADFYGSGFIINGNEVVGKVGKCRVTSRKTQGNKIQMSAECATDIAVASEQLSLRVDSDDKITRIFPSMPDMEMQYYRCPR